MAGDREDNERRVEFFRGDLKVILGADCVCDREVVGDITGVEEKWEKIVPQGEVKGLYDLAEKVIFLHRGWGDSQIIK